MRSISRRLFTLWGTSLILAGAMAAESDVAPAAKTTAYAYATNGVLDDIAGPFGSKWKLLLNASNLGGTELEAAELTMKAGTTVPAHMHQSVEVIYVLSGVYEHEVNGKRYRLTPGMVGIVRPGDEVRHIVPGERDTRVLILWAPGGEAARLSRAKGSTPAPVPEM